MELLRVGAEQFRRQLSELLGRVGYGKDRVIVEKNGTPLAVVIAYEEYERLTQEQENVETHTGVESLLRMRQKLREAGVTYEQLAEGMYRERMRTLRELYPEYYEKYVEEHDTTIEPA